MVEEIKFVKYKKFSDITLRFSNNINVIAGANGTCKTSLLHIISNSFKMPTSSASSMKEEKDCLSQIQNINHIFNPKIESLTKGDKEFNDPAKGVSGTLYSVTFKTDTNPLIIDFRKHNTSTDTLKEKSRYRIIPKYTAGSGTSLLAAPIIYLSLTRLFPFGEFSDNEVLNKISKKLPEKYQDKINALYKDFTKFEVSNVKHQKMGSLKHKSDFVTNKEGVDSNTISAGEDSLYIILTALVSLEYFYTIFSKPSILLLDEIDATLHPAFQIKLFNLLVGYAKTNNIQVFFTTHSLTLIEYALSSKEHVKYLLEVPSGIFEMEDVNMPTINRNLLNQTNDSPDIFIPKKIPIFTEDAEAKILLEMLLDFFHREDMDGFGKIRNFFYIVENISIGSTILRNMFENQTIDNFKGSICLLDGDQATKKSDIQNSIMCLPGKDSPEKFLFEYAKKLIQRDDPFWTNTLSIQSGYTVSAVQETLIEPYEKINAEYDSKKEGGVTTKGFKREAYKNLFNKNSNLMKTLFGHWIVQNKQETDEFYKTLQIMFYKNGKLKNIDISLWVR